MTHIDEILAALVEARRSGFEHTAAVLEDWLNREIEERDGVSPTTAKQLLKADYTSGPGV